MDGAPVLPRACSQRAIPAFFCKLLLLISAPLVAILIAFHGNTISLSISAAPTTASTALADILKESIHSLEEHMQLANGLAHEGDGNGKQEAQAMFDCFDLFNQTYDRLVDSLAAVTGASTAWPHTDVQTWLSGALTNYVTCLDGLTGDTALKVEAKLSASTALLSTALAVIDDNRNSMADRMMDAYGEFPEWLSVTDKKLMAGNWDKAEMADVVVAADGSGNYTTVTEAMNGAPMNSTMRYMIYIKKGTYKEQVLIPSSKTNIILVGDGMNSTIITGSLNVADGSTTYNSSTVGVFLSWLDSSTFN